MKRKAVSLIWPMMLMCLGMGIAADQADNGVTVPGLELKRVMRFPGQVERIYGSLFSPYAVELSCNGERSLSVLDEADKTVKALDAGA